MFITKQELAMLNTEYTTEELTSRDAELVEEVNPSDYSHEPYRDNAHVSELLAAGHGYVIESLPFREITRWSAPMSTRPDVTRSYRTIHYGSVTVYIDSYSDRPAIAKCVQCKRTHVANGDTREGQELFTAAVMAHGQSHTKQH